MNIQVELNGNQQQREAAVDSVINHLTAWLLSLEETGAERISVSMGELADGDGIGIQVAAQFPSR